MEDYKQVILIRSDLKLPKGKMAGQAAHAAVEAALKSDKKKISIWRSEGQKKVILKIDNEDQLYRLKIQAEELGLTTALITDAGKTVIAPGTTTCLAIGPDLEEEIDKVAGSLKLM